MPQIVWQIDYAAAAVALLALAAAMHAWVLYARSRAAIGWGRFVLLGLRWAALLALAAAAFRPTLQRVSDASVLPRVTVLLDNSTSMVAAGDTRSDAELVRLAEAFGGVSPSLRQRPSRQTLDALTAIARSLRENNRGDDALDMKAIARDLLAARDAAAADPVTKDLAPRIAAVADRADPKARPQELLRELMGIHIEVRRRDQAADERLLKADASVQAAIEPLRGATRFDLARKAIDLFAERLRGKAELRLTTLDRTFSSDALPTLTADATASPLIKALRDTTRDAAGSSAILLISDGRSTESQTVVPPGISAANVPIHTVAAAPARRQPDVRVLRVEAPPSALAGERLSVRVVLRSSNARGRAVDVKLKGAGEPQSRPVTLTGGDDAAVFDVPTTQPGTLTLVAEVAPMSGELESANNTASAAVELIERRVRVMLIAGTAGWDVQYLRNLLARTKWCELQEQILRDAPCLFTPDEITAADLIIIADVTAEALSPAQLTALNRAVTVQGRSVLLLPGEVANLASFGELPALAALLPQRVGELPAWRVTPGDEPAILPVPAKLVVMPPLITLDESSETSLAKWLARPRLFRLMEYGQLKPQARALMVDRFSQSPVLIEHAAGLGRVLTVATDETWRWRRAVGGEAHDAFWLQAVRHLLEPPPDAQNDKLALSLWRRRSAAGQNVDVRLRAPVDTQEATLILQQGDRVVSRQPLALLLPESGRFGGGVLAADPGEYTVKVEAAGSSVGAKLVIDANVAAELADTSPDPDLLRRVADATGGEFTALEEVGRLADSILAAPATRRAVSVYPLWCSPLLFGLVIGCLGLEWTLRKWFGMV
jgi:hypothetical protein